MVIKGRDFFSWILRWMVWSQLKNPSRVIKAVLGFRKSKRASEVHKYAVRLDGGKC